MAGNGLVNVDLTGLVSGAGDLALKIRQAITGDVPPELKAKLEESAIQAQQLVDVAQSQINLIDAQSTSFFRSGWRPACGWLCVFGLAWSTVIKTGIEWISIIAQKPIVLPQVETGILVSLLMGLLGLGTQRTIEKIKGIS